jgi:hypothetical protein
MLYEATGILRYGSAEYGHKLTVEVEQDLADYYRRLIPKAKGVIRQRYGAHVSVVRKETPVNLDAWGKYEGESIDFVYDSEVKSGKVYYWLNCFSTRLEEIRIELGLPVSSEYTRPPDSWVKCFHMTLGNTKDG